MYDEFTGYFSFRGYIEMDEYSSIIIYMHFVKDILCDVKSISQSRSTMPLFPSGFSKYFYNSLLCGF